VKPHNAIDPMRNAITISLVPSLERYRCLVCPARPHSGRRHM